MMNGNMIVNIVQLLCERLVQPPIEQRIKIIRIEQQQQQRSTSKTHYYNYDYNYNYYY